jgi:hypothetical protein
MARRKNKELREVSELKKQSSAFHIDLPADLVAMAKEVRKIVKEHRDAKYSGADTEMRTGLQLHVGDKIVDGVDPSGKVTHFYSIRELQMPEIPFTCHGVHVNRDQCFEPRLPVIEVLVS